jgi:hypothetical protein
MHLAPGTPHYCSIACFRRGTGLDDPITGDGKHLCPNAMGYLVAPRDSSLGEEAVEPDREVII